VGRPKSKRKSQHKNQQKKKKTSFPPQKAGKPTQRQNQPNSELLDEVAQNDASSGEMPEPLHRRVEALTGMRQEPPSFWGWLLSSAAAPFRWLGSFFGGQAGPSGNVPDKTPAEDAFAPESHASANPPAATEPVAGSGLPSITGTGNSAQETQSRRGSQVPPTAPPTAEEHAAAGSPPTAQTLDTIRRLIGKYVTSGNPKIIWQINRLRNKMDQGASDEDLHLYLEEFGKVLENVAKREQKSSGKTPADQTPADQTPADQTPADQTPADQSAAAPPAANAPARYSGPKIQPYRRNDGYYVGCVTGVHIHIVGDQTHLQIGSDRTNIRTASWEQDLHTALDQFDQQTLSKPGAWDCLYWICQELNVSVPDRLAGQDGGN
jgi:hypothetical protein